VRELSSGSVRNQQLSAAVRCGGGVHSSIGVQKDDSRESYYQSHSHISYSPFQERHCLLSTHPWCVKYKCRCPQQREAVAFAHLVRSRSRRLVSKSTYLPVARSTMGSAYGGSIRSPSVCSASSFLVPVIRARLRRSQLVDGFLGRFRKLLVYDLSFLLSDCRSDQMRYSC